MSKKEFQHTASIPNFRNPKKQASEVFIIIKNMEPTAETYFEKYFDEANKRHYFYNPFTRESVWEVPADATVIDRTKSLDFPPSTEGDAKAPAKTD